jgi:SPP1 gp7 family putative phage head morphogenesis protein
LSKISKAIDRLLDEIDDTRSFIVIKDKRAYNKLLKKLKDAILNAANDNIKSAYKEALEYLKGTNAGQFSELDAAKISEIVESKLGVDLQTATDEDVKKLTKDIFGLGKKEVVSSAGMKMSFDIADKEAVKILADQNLFWIGKGYGDNYKEKFDGILKDYFASSKTIDEVTADLAGQFNQLGERSYDYYNSLAEHQTNTVRELGKVNGFEAAGVVSYEIRAVIDDRTSDICLRLDGTVFPVERAIEYRDNILSLSNPEDIKQASPWLTPEQVAELPDDDAELPPGLSLPPYHFNCRTIIVANFE